MAHIGLDLRFYRAGAGGVSRYSRNLVHELLALDKTNQYTAILTPTDALEFKEEASNLRKLVVDASTYSYAEQIKLNDIILAGKFDLVHFSQFNHPILYRRPFVVTIHDLIMSLYPSGKMAHSLINKMAYNLTMNDCKRAKKVLVPSQSTKNDLVRMLNFPESKVVVIPEGSESHFAKPSAESIAKTKAKYNLPEKYIMFVSRWAKHKGLDILISAFEKVGIALPGVALVICGQASPQAPDIAALIEEKKKSLKIITPGFVSEEELANLYAGAGVYVHPSLYEGFGLMILEAFAAGAPVITSDTSSMPEVAGDAAILFDPTDSNELAEKIKLVLTDEKLASDLREKGFERVKRFSWRKMAEETLAVYNESLKP